MRRWALLENNIVVLITEQDDKPSLDGVWVECLSNAGPLWTYDGTSFSEPVPAPIPAIITKVAFRFRMTDAEYVGVLSAAKTDVEVAAWVETFNMVSQIDLDNQRTKDGVANLVSKNLLTQARADEILTAPVQPNERP